MSLKSSIKASIRHASLASLTAVFSTLGGALGLAMMALLEGWIPPVVGLLLGMYIALLVAYHNIKRELDEAQRKLNALTERKAKLRYRADQVRYGSLKAGDEYRHVVDVINLSRLPINGARLVLEGSDPDEPHVTYPHAPLGDRIGNQDGIFTLNPGDGIKPTIQIDVLQEFVRTKDMGSPPSNTEIRYLYANEARNRTGKFFRDKTDRVVTLRLEAADLPEAEWLRLHIHYDDVESRFEITEYR